MKGQAAVEHYFRLLMTEGLGLDLSDPNLLDTPKRVAKMYCQEFFRGIGEEFNGCKTFPNKKKYDQIIMLDRIDFVSVCSHHFLPFTGYAWIAYIPNKHLAGASKFARTVHHYAARPQLQENLCHEVIDCLKKNIKPRGLMVVMRATHGCMSCRGVKQSNKSGMMTSALKGVFKKDEKARSEVLDFIKISLMG